MSPTATTRARSRGSREHRPLARSHAGRRPEPGRTTLDDRITALWTRLVETGTADCPVCGHSLRAGRPCGGCGSELS